MPQTTQSPRDGLDPHEPPAPSDPPGLKRARRRAIIGWALYDLANTIFFLLVVTRYLPKQLFEITGSESAVSWSLVPTMLVAAILSPALGALVDRAGRAKALTFAITLVCCVATALLGFPKTALGVSLVYVVARFAYEMASVPYNALLPSVAAQAGLGAISGLGVALGYLGNVLALALLLVLDLEGRYGYWAVYTFAAFLFFAFTLPLQFWVSEVSPARPGPAGWRALAGATGSTFRAFGRQLRDPVRRNFLIGTFLVCDAINTVLVQVARYADRPEGLDLSDDGVLNFLIAIQVSAIVGGILLGRIADRISGRRTMLLSVAMLALGMASAQFLPGFWLRVVAMGVLGGAGLAGVWAAGRQWLVALVPREEIGEAFGFYGLAQRASVVTLLPFTTLFDRTQSYTSSVLLLLAFFLAGFVLLHRTPARAGP